MHAHHSTSIRPFSENPDFDFEIRTALGRAAAGAGDPGEILAATEGVPKNDHHGWVSAWSALADRTAQTAADAAAKGHKVSAAEAFLRASAYFSVVVDALSSLDDMPQLEHAFGRQQSMWQGFVAHTAAEVTAIEIPYENDPLPGWYFRADAPTAPTVVAVNGSDGALPGLWAACIQPALKRGYNVVAFDGPGQQSQLFVKKVPFRPDWENVLTPVLDAVLSFDGVDPDRVALYGISQGGFWVARAIAFEHRFAAAITDPGVVDVSTSWTSHLPHSLIGLLDDGELAKFDKEMAFGLKFSPDTARIWQFRARPYGTTGYAETIQTVRAYTVADVADRITTPLLILSPENEQFWPGQAEELAALTPAVSSVVSFTAAEGADGHCQPLARALTAQRMFDWLDETLGA